MQPAEMVGWENIGLVAGAAGVGWVFHLISSWPGPTRAEHADLIAKIDGLEQALADRLMRVEERQIKVLERLSRLEARYGFTGRGEPQ